MPINFNQFQLFENTYISYAVAEQVWDYTNDAYVHRLVLSKKDGRLVEIPAPGLAPQEAARGAHDGAAQPDGVAGVAASLGEATAT